LLKGTYGLVAYRGNYITFLDAILQLGAVGSSEKGLKLPEKFSEIKLRPISSQGLDVPVHIDR